MTLQKECFIDKLEHCYGEISSKGAINRVREKAWKRLQDIGLPTKEKETYRYVPLRKYYQCDLTLASKDNELSSLDSKVLPECKNSCIVFVNGSFSPDLSSLSALPDGVDVLPLEEAFGRYSALLQGSMKSLLKTETDGFVLANLSMLNDGVFVYVPPGTIVEAPLQVLHVGSEAHSHEAYFPHMRVFSGANSHLKIYSSVDEKMTSSGHLYSLIDFQLNDGAQVDYSLKDCPESKEAWHFHMVRATLKRDSQFKSISATTGSATVRQDYFIELQEENAFADLSGAGLLSGLRQAHVNVLMRHLAPHCNSKQLFKNVVADTSKVSVEGKVFVDAIAQKTDAFQLINSLLIGEGMAYTKPNLEIFADDVKCSHGATMGQIDDDILFYLKSRGIEEAAARSLLIKGFLASLVEGISLDSLRVELIEKVGNFLKKEV